MRQLLALVPLLTVVTLSAQTPAAPAAFFIGGQPTPAPPWDAPHLEFEVASVKTNKSGPGTMMMMRTLPTSFNVTNLPLRTLIIAGLPSLAVSTRRRAELDRLRALRHRRESARRLEA